MNTIDKLIEDCTDDELPRDLAAFDKVKTTLKIGMRVGWYYKEDEEFWREDGLDPRENTQYSGIIIPRPDLVMRGCNLEAEDCVIVMTDYPVEKEYCEATWFSLRRLLDNPELVEVFDELLAVKE